MISLDFEYWRKLVKAVEIAVISRGKLTTFADLGIRVNGAVEHYCIVTRNNLSRWSPSLVERRKISRRVLKNRRRRSIYRYLLEVPRMITIRYKNWRKVHHFMRSVVPFNIHVISCQSCVTGSTATLRIRLPLLQPYDSQSESQGSRLYLR